MVLQNSSYFKERRQKLVKKINQKYRAGVLALVAGFDNEQYPFPFRQNNDFYYLTGMQEAGLVLLCYPDGKEILYTPCYPDMRKKWVTGGLHSDDDPALCGVDKILPLGQLMNSYDCPFLYHEARYKNLLADLKRDVVNGLRLFVQTDVSSMLADTTTLLWKWFERLVPELREFFVDISALAHDMRRTKDNQELLYLKKAIAITLDAQKAAAQAIKEGVLEYEVLAALEYVFRCNGAGNAFPSIVATGVNSTILHYTDTAATIEKGDLVVIDIGAERFGYAADITRTYPVGGAFTDRQKEIYECVYETQLYIQSLARPGMFLKNNDNPADSLHHCAVEFLTTKGYNRYFVHGIGHYLGLDVHDVGTYATPLRQGDVITIEPGIYIREEALGVRIEDNYLITDKGCDRLSDGLGADINTIMSLMS